jgi:hypothetical protein
MRTEAMKVAMKYVTVDYLEDLTQIFHQIDTGATGFVNAEDL